MLFKEISSVATRPISLVQQNTSVLSRSSTTYSMSRRDHAGKEEDSGWQFSNDTELMITITSTIYTEDTSHIINTQFVTSLWVSPSLIDAGAAYIVHDQSAALKPCCSGENCTNSQPIICENCTQPRANRFRYAYLYVNSQDCIKDRALTYFCPR